MSNRLDRLAPLTGALSAMLGFAAFASSSPPPAAKADGSLVIAFYQAHSSGQQRSDILWMLAFAFFLFFAGSLRSHLRRLPATEGIAAVMLAGAALMGAGAISFFCFDYVLAVAPSQLAPAAAQALNVLGLTFILPFGAGGLVFGVAGGLAILRGGQLPKWVGWLAILIGILTASPAGLVGLVAFLLWAAVLGILMWRRTDTADPAAVAPASS